MSVFLAVTFFSSDEEEVEQHLDENGDDWKNGGEMSDRTRFTQFCRANVKMGSSLKRISFVSLKSLLPKFLNR